MNLRLKAYVLLLPFFASRLSFGQTLTTDSKNDLVNYHPSIDSLRVVVTDSCTKTIKVPAWISETVVSGYIPAGIFDIGKIQTIARLTDIEGLRLTLPFQTNEHLWKNISIGGYIGYGFKNREIKCSALSQIRLPFKNRMIIGVSYTNDYRRVDYDYNDFVVRENPLATGDIDIGGTILAFKSVGDMNLREETAVNCTTDWNHNIETTVFLRNNDIYSSPALQLHRMDVFFDKLNQKSVTAVTRFSFSESVYDKHLQRIYIPNNEPAIYAIADFGKYNIGNRNGFYAKLSTIVRQNIDFKSGRWSYMAEAGCVIGKVPYPLLEIPYGRQTGGYNRFQFSLLNYMEYASDRYVSMHNDITFNSIIMGKIPFIKYLQLKELISFKIYYGTLNQDHRQILDFPESIRTTQKPYSEIGVGFSNILHLFTLQSVWRLSDNQLSGMPRWALKGSIRITL